ncbi:hypothetical protein Q0N12_11030 [Rossellomorea marisflavi]|uniref:hypothetical protein n=1 Tax=Rossellomorea marisflavi TaxID=189381 RepID=UPI003457EE9E
MTYVQLGALSIPASWLAVVVALITGSILHRIATKRKTGDWYWNGAFLYIVIWKLSYIFFHFNLFIQTPMSILYYNGGLYGHFIALAALSYHLLIKNRKERLQHPEDGARTLFFFLLSDEASISFFQRDWLHGGVNTLVLIGFFIWTSVLKEEMKGVLLLFLLLGLLSMSLFDDIYSIRTLTFLWIGAIALILSPKRRND